MAAHQRHFTMEDLVPTRAMFVIMLLLSSGQEKHGYALLTESEGLAHGEFVLNAGTLYRSLKVMLEREWVLEINETHHGEEMDQRRRLYVITPMGQQALKEEVNRLWTLIKLALEED